MRFFAPSLIYNNYWLGQVLFAVLFIGLVSAAEVDFSCPNDIFAGEEFECSLEVSDGDGVYDVKVEADKERNSVLEIWDESDGWKSGYYYLIGFIENGDEKSLKLIISEVGKYDVILKLRQGDSREDFDIGKIEAVVSLEIESEDLQAVHSEEKNIGVISLDRKVEIISLSPVSDYIEDGDKKEEWDYVSKDGRIVDWLPYGFCLFLICLVGILLLDRF
jgi:hypothetical protein